LAEIRTIAVIGAGLAGRAIACVAALGGYRTILEDILPGSLRRAEDELCDKLDHQSLARIEYGSTVEEAARQADLVIEAVPDELESKLEIFTLLDKVCKPQTILALTSSILSVSEVSSVTCRPQKCVGIRFSQWDRQTVRVELVRGPETDQETSAACLEMGGRMAREVVLVDENCV
jgi:3-hydroxybutyryl-CoA dehydrogenase